LAEKLTSLLAEAKRRRVFRTAGVYLVAVWGISSGGVDVAGVLGIPENVLRVTMIGAIAFLPVVVILAWMFDIGRSGIVRDPEDVLDEQQAEQDLASMPTIIGGDKGAGAVVVRWDDEHGGNAMLYVDEFYLGRGTDCRVRFYDPLVSRQHAKVFHEDGVWYIEDLGSRNGTHVDDQAIKQVALADSSAVRVNDTGPFVQIDLVRSGAETRSALASHPPGQPTAHLRAPSSGMGSSASAGHSAGIGQSGRPVTRKK
jgi:hypothetical protein